ncbi:MAG TPA: hypothetical protein PKK68_04570 [Methanothrix soehngenii]|nr:hypothetical protein [Methanothrix soehngenii]HPT18421.1 hypothetical protein [Methanothrix sp.]
MRRKIYRIFILSVWLLTVWSMVGAASADLFSIYAYDSNGNTACDAHITVYQGTTYIKDGYANDNCRWRTDLNLYTSYRITASWGGQYGDWKSSLDGSESRISIYMH